MPDFTEVGFLGDELTTFTENVRAKHVIGFRYMEQTNALAMRVMWTLPLADLDEAMAHAIMCYARAVQNFQGVILMSERGAITEAVSCCELWLRRCFWLLAWSKKQTCLRSFRRTPQHIARVLRTRLSK